MVFLEIVRDSYVLFQETSKILLGNWTIWSYSWTIRDHSGNDSRIYPESSRNGTECDRESFNPKLRSNCLFCLVLFQDSYCSLPEAFQILIRQFLCMNVSWTIRSHSWTIRDDSGNDSRMYPESSRNGTECDRESFNPNFGASTELAILTKIWLCDETWRRDMIGGGSDPPSSHVGCSEFFHLSHCFTLIEHYLSSKNKTAL